MTRKEKYKFIQQLAQQLKENGGFYLIQISGLKGGQNNLLRRNFHGKGLRVKAVKNTLLGKAFEYVAHEVGGDGHNKPYEALFALLKEDTAIIFVNEDTFNIPAKLIKSYREENGTDWPRLKGAYLDGDVYIGEEQLEVLASLKSKEELIGEVISLLQSPLYGVLNVLRSGQDTILGVLKAITQSKEN